MKGLSLGPKQEEEEEESNFTTTKYFCLL